MGLAIQSSNYTDCNGSKLNEAMSGCSSGGSGLRARREKGEWLGWSRKPRVQEEGLVIARRGGVAGRSGRQWIASEVLWRSI